MATVAPGNHGDPISVIVADHEIEEHAEVQRLLKDLEGVDATDRTFDDVIGRLSKEVRHHIGEEESDLLPGCSRPARRRNCWSSAGWSTGRRGPHRPGGTRPHRRNHRSTSSSPQAPA